MKAPAPLRRAGLLVLAQGVALTVIGVVYAVSGILAHPSDRLATVLAGGLAAAVGLGLVAVGRGLSAARGWAWSPALLTQVFATVVGLGLLQGHVWLPAAVLLALAGGVLSQLATPTARASYRSRS